jgi:hypothetical protein
MTVSSKPKYNFKETIFNPANPFFGKSDKEIINEIKANPATFIYLNEQPIEITELVIQSKPELLPFVKEQTEELCLLCVKNHGTMLSLVKEQTKAICIAAVENNKNAIQFVWDQFLYLFIEDIKELKIYDSLLERFSVARFFKNNSRDKMVTVYPDLTVSLNKVLEYKGLNDNISITLSNCDPVAECDSYGKPKLVIFKDGDSNNYVLLSERTVLQPYNTDGKTVPPISIYPYKLYNQERLYEYVEIEETDDVVQLRYIDTFPYKKITFYKCLENVRIDQNHVFRLVDGDVEFWIVYRNYKSFFRTVDNYGNSSLPLEEFKKLTII